jgi:hypothetical protein
MCLNSDAEPSGSISKAEFNTHSIKNNSCIFLTADLFYTMEEGKLINPLKHEVYLNNRSLKFQIFLRKKQRFSI